MAGNSKKERAGLSARIEKIFVPDAPAVADSLDPDLAAYLNDFLSGCSKIGPLEHFDLTTREGALEAVRICNEKLAVLERQRRIAAALTKFSRSRGSE